MTEENFRMRPAATRLIDYCEREERADMLLALARPMLLQQAVYLMQATRAEVRPDLDPVKQRQAERHAVARKDTKRVFKTRTSRIVKTVLATYMLGGKSLGDHTPESALVAAEKIARDGLRRHLRGEATLHFVQELVAGLKPGVSIDEQVDPARAQDLYDYHFVRGSKKAKARSRVSA